MINWRSLLKQSSPNKFYYDPTGLLYIGTEIIFNEKDNVKYMIQRE